jgi:hypothetical protein
LPPPPIAPKFNRFKECHFFPKCQPTDFQGKKKWGKPRILKGENMYFEVCFGGFFSSGEKAVFHAKGE